jgi:kynurenine formamidase
MSKIIDLTLTVSPKLRGVEFEQFTTVAKEGWNSRKLHLYSHSGTHMDAPLHFGVSDETIDQISLDDCLGPAWVVDLTRLAPKALITVADLGPVAEKIKPGDRLLLKSGWCRHIDDPKYYRDNFPRISEDLARWLVARQLRLLGVEPPSIADVNDLKEVTLIHQILLGGRIIIVEGLANLEALTQDRVWFCAAPLRIEGGDGAPCRAFAIEGDSWAR